MAHRQRNIIRFLFTALFLAVCYLGYWGANRRISL